MKVRFTFKINYYLRIILTVYTFCYGVPNTYTDIVNDKFNYIIKYSQGTS